jgi:hypothetical protein
MVGGADAERAGFQVNTGWLATTEHEGRMPECMDGLWSYWDAASGQFRADTGIAFHKATGRSGRWQRVASKSLPGEFYYYDTETGRSQPEPPAPWIRAEGSYWNPDTGQHSSEKPEM